jgi:hypothetical protein
MLVAEDILFMKAETWRTVLHPERRPAMYKDFPHFILSTCPSLCMCMIPIIRGSGKGV